MEIMPIMKISEKQKTRLEARARILKALGHPTRVYIIEELARKPHCVNDLTGMIGADISTVSKHLSILKAEGLILDQKRGKNVYYSLRMRCVLNFLDCCETVLMEQVKDRMTALG